MDPQTRGRKLLDYILDGNEEAIKELLAVDPGGIDFKAETRGDNAIHLAARRGNVSLIRKLYRLGVKAQSKEPGEEHGDALRS
ncbi:hypothetical protein DPMN_103812 [Dreissena polymorpha]|uniref:Uncharacterized protein n=1 Tax=Dreissena polymorpha TaxID=45954 RepID=A0A9D4HEV6_DREPO|nr:hypothetical protein DPMN_103812 [Dreissena polymorpha]